jgi:Fe-S-cluster-containing dehydrogenase component
MSKWNMIIDVAKCHNCRNCFITCKDEHVGNDFPGYAAPQPLHGHEWISVATKERGSAPMVDVAHLPTMCNQCDAAPCVAKAADGAVYQRPDGIVIIDPAKARGRRDIVESCPYGAIWWNEELQLPQKYIFDAHLLDQGWTEPRAVQACPTGAMRALKADDATMARLRAEEQLQVLRPELNTRPRVYYRSLERFTSSFVGATVVARHGEVVDCVADAEAVLLRAGERLGASRTDDFGDFRFDGLPTSERDYEIRVSKDGVGAAKVAVTVGESRYLGEILLSAA